MIAFLKNLWATEPAIVVSVIVSAIVAVFANFGIVVNEVSLETALLAIIPILLGGVVTRSHVTPV